MENPITETCRRCFKIPPLCVCDSAAVQENRTPVLILQHPQEPDKELGSARLANLILGNSVLRTGLSFRNLKVLMGEDAEPSRWIVLFLGVRYKFNKAASAENVSDIQIYDRKDEPAAMPLHAIRGLIVLDGTWSQAKTMWWRNPWLLKCRRAVINPRRGSFYGKLRREPRRECLSTIESIAYTLEILGEAPAVSDALLSGFKALLAKYKAHAKATGRRASSPRRDRRRRPGKRTRRS